MADRVFIRRAPRNGPVSRTLAVVLGAALAVAVVQVRAPAAAVAAAKAPSVPSAKASTGVFTIKPHAGAKPADAAAKTAATAAVSWPTVANVHVGSAAGVPPGRFDVAVADRTAAARAGIDGAIFSVTPRRQASAAETSASGAAEVSFDYSGLANAYGGDYGSRLRLVQLPACALTTPQLAACQTRTPVAGVVNSPRTHTLSAPMTSSSALVLAATTGATTASATGIGGAGGTFGATTLKPSGTWAEGGPSGSFAYTYPLAVPPAASPLVPSLSLTYDSGDVDGQTAATQSQAGWLGDGWSTPQAFIEQSFTSCADSPEGSASPKSTPDRCYDGPVLMLTLNGSSVPLVWDSGSGTYKAADDSGEVVKHITGSNNGSGTYNTDYWQVTDRTGTVFQFGRNQLPGWAAGKPTTDSVDSEPVFSAHSGDPCYKSSGFADSVCTMAYRWNLDYVKDLHGNAMAYYYKQDTNAYAENADTSGTTTPTATGTYTRDSHLDHIDYGFTDGGAYSVNGGHAPDQVLFTTGDRCLSGTCDPLNKTNAANWPDVPYDLHCDANQTCYITSPSIWSTVRLTGIKTQQWNGTAYVPADSWSFTQTIPATGDGTSPTLWLSAITHTGADSTAGGSAVTLPAVTFTAVALANRVDVSTLPPLTRMRISSITTETGSVIGVNYTLTNPCTAPVTVNAASNTSSCYPVYWTPADNTQPLKDWFNKYQVDSVTQSDPNGGAPDAKTSYKYLGGGAWHFDDNELVKAKYRTYGQWRGFGDVQTFTGQGTDARTESETTYYRGMSRDDNTTVVNLTDSQGGVHEDVDQLLGKALETTHRSFEGGPITSSTISSYWVSPATATRARTGLDALTANAVGEVEAWDRQALSSSAGTTWRISETDTSYDADPSSSTFGLPLFSLAHGDLAVPTQQRCTATTYAPPNSAANLTGLPAEVEIVGAACGGTNPSGASVPGAGQINALKAASSVNRPADVVSDTRTVYDNPALAATWPQPATITWPQPAPTLGDVSEVLTADGFSNGAYHRQVKSATLYDSFGVPRRVYDGLGRSTSTDRTVTNGSVTATRTTNALGQSTSATLDPVRALPVTATDLNGITSIRHYDGLGRVVAQWSANRPVSAPADQLVSYAISPTAPTSVTTQTLNDSLGYQSSVTLYDALERVRQTQVPTPQGGRLVTDTFYDSRGWAWKKNNAWWDSAATPSTSLAGVPDSQVPNQDVIAFDGAGRPVLDTSYNDSQPVSKTATMYDVAASGSGDGTITVPLNASGAPFAGGTAKTAVKDALDRIIEQDEYTVPPTVTVTTSSDTAPITHVAITGGTTQATRSVFNTAGHQTDTVNVPTGADWHHDYDLLGRIVSSTDPDAGASTASYDAAGQLLQSTDARGQTQSFTYDALGRKTGEYAAAVTGQNSANQIAAWVYDNSNNAVAGMTYPIGHVTSSTAYQGGNAYLTQARGFNVFGESLGETVTIPSSEGALAGSYSFTDKYSTTKGLHVQSSFPATGNLPAETLTYGYSGALDLPVSLSGLPGYYAQNTTYTAYSQVGQEQLGTTASTASYLTATYDSHSGDLTDSTLTHPSAGSTPLDEVSYTYDPAGNPTSQTDKRQGTATETQCYRYDALARLTEAWTATDACAADPSQNSGATVGDGIAGSAYWTSWQLDPLGQRQSETDHGLSGQADNVTTYSYGTAQPHTLKGTSSTGPVGTASSAFGYDPAGNTITRSVPNQGSQTLTWDARGKLTGVASSAGTSAYIYDADGTLLLQRDPGKVTLYLSDEQLTLDTTTGLVSGSRTYELPGGGTVVRTGGSYVFEVTDRHGTPLLTIDPTFTAMTWRQQTPFGAPRGTTPNSWPDNHGFLNKPQDTTTGLTAVGARWYDPATGRFASLDPVFETTDSQQQNGYTYAAANPVSSSDPEGLYTCRNGHEGCDAHGNPPCSDGNCNGDTQPGDCVHTECGHGRDQNSEDPFRGTDGYAHHTVQYSGNNATAAQRLLAEWNLEHVRQMLRQKITETNRHSGCNGFWGCTFHYIGVGLHDVASIYNNKWASLAITTIGVVTCIAATAGVCTAVAVTIAAGSIATRWTNYADGPKTPGRTFDAVGGTALDIVGALAPGGAKAKNACGCYRFAPFLTSVVIQTGIGAGNWIAQGGPFEK